MKLLAAVAAALLATPAIAAPSPISNASAYIQSRNRPPPPLAYRGPLANLAMSRINSFSVPGCGVNNGAAIKKLLDFLKTKPAMEYPLAVVPGSSEGACHHCAWPQRRTQDTHWVEPNFRSRLRHAFLLLHDGVVHSILISGGSIDAQHPEYNEAIYGFRELVSEYGPVWAKLNRGPLEQRLIVDPWAVHSEVNVRNGDRLTRLVGLDRNLIVTEVGSMKRQGWWFVHHSDLPGVFGSFDGKAEKVFGFKLGEFEELGEAPIFKRYVPKSVRDRNGVRPGQYTNSAGSHPEIPYIPSCNYSGGKCEAVDTAAIAHFNLRAIANLMDGGDARWDLGRLDPEFSKPPPGPNAARVAQACEALKKKLH